MNFFEHLCFLTARQPRTDCPEHGVLVSGVPWALPGSGFTLLFESFAVELVRAGLAVAPASRIVGEHDTRLWRLLERHVEDARARADHSTVVAAGVDETSRGGADAFVTVFVDPAVPRVLFVAEGKDHRTVEAFRGDLVAHGGDPAGVVDFSLDMSSAFMKGIRTSFPGAMLTFDRFHVMKLMNDAIDEVRRHEQKQRPELKNTRWMWLRNPCNHSPAEAERFAELKDGTLAVARAWRIKEMLQLLYDESLATAPSFFRKWYFWATHSRLRPVIRLAKTLKKHAPGVLRWFKTGLSNGLLEGINSIIQAAKAKARGFRSPRKMMTIIYLLLGKLDFRLPNALPSATHSW
jgi:transposase